MGGHGYTGVIRGLRVCSRGLVQIKHFLPPSLSNSSLDLSDQVAQTLNIMTVGVSTAAVKYSSTFRNQENIVGLGTSGADPGFSTETGEPTLGGGGHLNIRLHNKNSEKLPEIADILVHWLTPPSSPLDQRMQYGVTKGPFHIEY